MKKRKHIFLICMLILMLGGIIKINDPLIACASEEDELPICTEVVDLNTIFEETESELWLRSAKNGVVDLKSGSYEKWIDRISIPSYGTDFYKTLVEYTDNDGVKDLLISDNGFAKSKAETVNFGGDYGSDTFNAIKIVTKKNVSSTEKSYIFKVIRAVYECFIMDHPEVFWFSGNTQGYCIEYGNEYTFYFLIKMHSGSYSSAFDLREKKYQTSGSIAKDIAVRDRAVTNLLNSKEVLSAGNPYETVKAFNKLLTKNNEYNTSQLASNSSEFFQAHSCLSALVGRSGKNGPVCEGYAKAFKVLCDRKEIPCVLLTGTAYNSSQDTSTLHSWNIVQLDEEWYIVDVSWNDPVVKGISGASSGYENENYFLVGSQSVVKGTKMSSSHRVSNKVSSNGISYTNIPQVSSSKYDIHAFSKDVFRVYGKNRYETSINIAEEIKFQSGIDKFQTMILANGTGFADALAGSYLASRKDAPILMISDQYLSTLRTYVSENLAEGGTIYLLGGKKAISKTVEDSLAQFANVTRLSGNDRYETNLAILEEAGVENEDILVCTGKSFADSLSASAAGKPILLVGDSLSEMQIAFLDSHSLGMFYMIGGLSAVSNELEIQLQNYGHTERIGGKSRYETSVLFAEKFFNKPSSIIVAYAKNFPDGLCGCALAMNMNAPLILTADDNFSDASSYAKRNAIQSGFVLGGSKLIAGQTAKSIFNLSAATKITTRR